MIGQTRLSSAVIQILGGRDNFQGIHAINERLASSHHISQYERALLQQAAFQFEPAVSMNPTVEVSSPYSMSASFKALMK
jgi:hypothetical protein